MTSSQFASAREYLDWAREAIDELTASSDAFFDSKPFREVREFDAAANQNILKVVLVSKLPQSIPRKANEALLNIKHSFDRAIYAACMAIGQLPKDSVYFPWAKNPIDLDFRLGAKTKPGKTGRTNIPTEFWSALRRLEPYGRSDTYAGGDDLIRQLAKIANRKHTMRLNFGAEVAEGNFPSFVGSMKGPSKFELGNCRWDSTKNEIILARFPTIMQTDYKYDLKMYIAFNEALPLKGAHLIGALEKFRAYGKRVLQAFESEADLILKRKNNNT